MVKLKSPDLDLCILSNVQNDARNLRELINMGLDDKGLKEACQFDITHLKRCCDYEGIPLQPYLDCYLKIVLHG